MRCYVMYLHPKNGNEYYFVDLRDRDGKLLPVGCFPYRMKRKATVFETKRDALRLASYLDSLGYKSCVVS